MNYTSKQREIILLKTVAVQEDIVKHYKELLAIGTEEPEKPTEAVTEPGILIMDEVFGGAVEDVVEAPVEETANGRKIPPFPKMLGTDRAKQIVSLLKDAPKEWTYKTLGLHFGYTESYANQIVRKFMVIGRDYDLRVDGTGTYWFRAVGADDVLE